MSYPSSSPRGGAGLLIGAAIIAVLIGAFFLFAPYYSTQLWWFFRSAWFWFMPLLILIIMAIVAAALIDSGKSGGGPLVLLIIAGLIGFIGWLFVYNYAQDAVYAASIKVTDDPPPSFAVRAPFSVSAAQVRSNLGDISGDTQDTMYVPEDQTFATLVEQRGFTTGYQTLLEQKIGTTGRNTPSRCNFDETRAGARLGGDFGGNLGRLINEKQRWVNWSKSDAFGWCDPQGTPFVVVPLTEQEGFFIITEKPAGVALYNGKTGEMDIRQNADGIPGPTYPLSLAAQQRESSHALNGFWDWQFDRAGWELPDEEDSINSSNQSEFVLATSGGGEAYVTPESARGKATAISAFTMVDAHLAGPELATVTVHKLGAKTPVWQSATALTDRVRANFGDVFAQQRDANIFELAPTGPNAWVATIGTPQNMIYRVTGTGDLSADPCLEDLTGKQLRCGPTGNIGVATGGGATPTTPTGPQVAPAPANSDLGTLTPTQLVDLQKRAADELARRLAAAGAGG